MPHIKVTLAQSVTKAGAEAQWRLLGFLSYYEGSSLAELTAKTIDKAFRKNALFHDIANCDKAG